MPDTEPNWVDPDILAYFDGSEVATFDFESEKDFKEFFEVGWLDPKYDDLRERWDKHIHDPDPYGRLLGKTALWNLVQLRNIQSRVQ